MSMGTCTPVERAGGQCGGFPAASGKNGSGVATDLLRMVRQQKLQRLTLCKDPIYMQYLSTEKQRAVHMRRKGWVENGARPQMDDDLDSEARQRVTALVSSAAKNRGRGQAGVWAAFGKPYTTLGMLKQVSDSKSLFGMPSLAYLRDTALKDHFAVSHKTDHCGVGGGRGGKKARSG